MNFFRKPGRREVLIGLGALGAGGLIANRDSLHYLRLLGGGTDFEIGSVRLRSLGNLKLSYVLPELFRFSCYAKPDPGGAFTTIYFPQEDETCQEAYLKGCSYPGAVRILHKELPSDMYLAGVERHYCPLVIPAADSRNRICVITPDHTYRAYNKFGGMSLYDPELYNNYGYENGNRPYYRLSWFNDPIKLNIFSYLKRYNFGYDVVSHDYVELNGASLTGYDLLILYGHDEYWTENFRRRIELHLLKGGNLLNLSGNTAYWRVRLDGNLMRLTRKNGADLWHKIDPVEKLLGANFRSAGYALPMRFRDNEEELGRIVSSLGHPDLPFSIGLKELRRKLTGIRLTDVNHPIFEGTGFQTGRWIGTESQVIVHELDGVPLREDSSIDWNLAKDFPRDLRVFGEVWAIWPTHGPHSRVRHAGVMNEFRYQGRGTVLSFPTIGWTRALYWDDDEIVAITNNAIKYLLSKQ